MCSAHWVVSNYIPCGFYPETLKWHFPLCCANWKEEARVKQRVAYGFSSLIVALEICLSLRALELGKSGTAIIMDNRNAEDCYPLSCPTEYWFFQLGLWLWCYFTDKSKESEQRKIVLQGDQHGARLCCGLTLLYVGVWRHISLIQVKSKSSLLDAVLQGPLDCLVSYLH